MDNHPLCPCGSKKNYEGCCQPYHNGSSAAPSAEALMRSRYSAYAMNVLDYIASTMMGKVAKGFDREHSELNQNHTKWLALDVVQSSVDNNNPNHAYVEFRALFSFDEKNSVMHELSEFKRVDGRWFYIDGKTKKGSRNDLCPCGSGKKLKRCHGGLEH